MKEHEPNNDLQCASISIAPTYSWSLYDTATMQDFSNWHGFLRFTCHETYIQYTWHSHTELEDSDIMTWLVLLIMWCSESPLCLSSNDKDTMHTSALVSKNVTLSNYRSHWFYIWVTDPTLVAMCNNCLRERRTRESVTGVDDAQIMRHIQLLIGQSLS